ncbi:MAG: fumarylacetoacetate hydrolase family protein [Chloroflexi bacterium]|nr:fumarylacetoacetate hydrolase family protein [Chloroflexota bacterium]MBU1748942.1 fumarylacetoacetate hydrolase family protein [Chloroflexota bacterium]
MRIIRYRYQDQVDWGVVVRRTLRVGDTVHALVGTLYGDVAPGAPVQPLDRVTLLAPCQPTKIVAVGRNYAAHAAELGNEVPEEPIIFLKPPSAIIGPEETIVWPAASERVDHEGELAAIIGRCCHAITPAEAAGVVWGYTCANDVTARDLQKRGGGPWSRGKGYDTFCPLGPWVETELDPGDLRITTRVAGEIRQDSRTSLMIYNIPTLISFISHIMTLEPGDVVLTGTPAGVGPVVPDQTVEVEVQGIGVLRNRVAGPQ